MDGLFRKLRNNTHTMTETCRTCDRVLALSRYPVMVYLTRRRDTGERVSLSAESTADGKNFGVFVIEGIRDRTVRATYGPAESVAGSEITGGILRFTGDY